MSRAWLAIPALCAVALAALAFVQPAAAARGWMIAFVAAGTPVLGGVLLSLIGGLTGGRWVPAVRRLAAAAPALLPLFLLLWLASPKVYPWIGNPHTPAHSPQFLGPALFGLRSLVGLVIWSVLAVLMVRGRASRVVLGLGILAHAVLLLLLSVDWILSLQPGWMSTDFPMSLAGQQVAAAAAFAILVTAASEGERSDLGVLLIAGVIGVAYFGFMDFLVVWYGNLPDKVAWYLVRGGLAGRTLAVIALVLGAAAPPVLRALPRLSVGVKTRAMAVCALAGLVAYQLFLLVPALSAVSLAAAVLALVVQGAALVWTAGRVLSAAPAGSLAHV